MSASRCQTDGNPVAFAREIERLRKVAEPAPADGTVAYLTKKYRESEDFKTLSESTRTSYALHLDRMDAAWGPLSFELNDGVVLALRDHLSGTPGMANQLLSVGRTVWKWGASTGVKSNQFLLVKDLHIPDRGHIPWPAWAVEVVSANASPDLVRMVRLGMMTCQRESDLIRMGPAHREKHGLWCRPKKTKKKRKAFCIPLTPADAKTLDRWATTAITFTNSRWLAPIARHNPELYLYSPRGVAYTETSLRARWHRWLDTDAGKALCVRWRAWVAEMVKKYEWEFEPDERSIRRFTACAAPVSSFVVPRATTSIRSPTTSACRARWSNATCASATRWRLQWRATRSCSSSRVPVDGLDSERVVA